MRNFLVGLVALGLILGNGSAVGAVSQAGGDRLASRTGTRAGADSGSGCRRSVRSASSADPTGRHRPTAGPDWRLDDPNDFCIPPAHPNNCESPCSEEIRPERR